MSTDNVYFTASTGHKSNNPMIIDALNAIHRGMQRRDWVRYRIQLVGVDRCRRDPRWEHAFLRAWTQARAMIKREACDANR